MVGGGEEVKPTRPSRRRALLGVPVDVRIGQDLITADGVQPFLGGLERRLQTQRSLVEARRASPVAADGVITGRQPHSVSQSAQSGVHLALTRVFLVSARILEIWREFAEKGRGAPHGVCPMHSVAPSGVQVRHVEVQRHHTGRRLQRHVVRQDGGVKLAAPVQDVGQAEQTDVLQSRYKTASLFQCLTACVFREQGFQLEQGL